MARINISIPDDLYLRIKRLRKKVKINVSEVCSRALELKIYKLEKARKRKK